MPMKTGAALLLVGGGLLGMRGCENGRDRFHAGVTHRSGGIGVEVVAESAPGGRSADRRLTAEQARARVNSLLSVSPGEVAVIGIPPGMLERHFEFAEPENEAERQLPG